MHLLRDFPAGADELVATNLSLIVIAARLVRAWLGCSSAGELNEADDGDLGRSLPSTRQLLGVQQLRCARETQTHH